MNIHEYQAKQVLNKYGVPTSHGIVALKAGDIDNLLYNCVGVYSIPLLEKIYNSSNVCDLSIFKFVIIFFFIVSIVSSE